MGKKQALLQGFINRYIWNVNIENPSVPLSDYFKADSTKSGEHVDYDTALKFSAVWACGRALANPISYLPIRLYRRTADGRERVTGHRVLNTIYEPNEYTTKPVIIERAISNLVHLGNMYIIPHYKKEGAGRVLHKLEYVHAKRVDVKSSGEGANRKITYHVKPLDEKAKGAKERILLPDEIIHVPHLGDDIKGKSTISYAREDIGLELAVRNYGASTYENGGEVQGVLSVKSQIKAEQMKQVEDRIREQKRRSKFLVVGADSTYQKFNISPVDAEFVASRHFNVETICRWYGVPLHKVQELSHGATYNNVEQMGLQFLQDSLAPIISKLEAEFNKKLFTEKEQRSGLYLEFDMGAYLRADSMAMAELMRTEIQNGVSTPDEWRIKLGKPKRTESDKLFMQSGTMPIDQLNQQNNE
jgi:HK97 family phage portal protein